MDKIINSAKNTPLACDFQNIFIVVSNQENLALLKKIVLLCN